MSYMEGQASTTAPSHEFWSDWNVGFELAFSSRPNICKYDIDNITTTTHDFVL